MVYTKTTTKLKAGRVPAIALCESNDNGGRHFMYLYIGNHIHG